MLINNKRYLSVITLFFLLIFQMCSSLAFAERTKPSINLPISTAEFPPFKFTDQKTGKIVGFDTDIITKVFYSIGIAPQISVLPFHRADIATRKGKYAAYYTFTKNADREKDYFFSDPISSVQDFIFFLKSSNISWEKYKDLLNYSLGYSAKYNYDKKFISGIKNKFPIMNDEPEKHLLSLLTRKRFDMIICEVSVCSYLIKQNPEKFKEIDFFKKTIGPPEPRPFHVGFSKKWPNSRKLRDDFNLALEKFVSHPSRQRKILIEKYGGHCSGILFPECK